MKSIVSGVLKDKQAGSGLQKAGQPHMLHHGVVERGGRAEPLRWPFIGDVPSANVFDSVFDPLSCAMKAEDDPSYQRTMLAWLEAKGGWNRSGLFRFIDLDHLSDEELAAVAHGESIEAVLARTRAGRAEAAGS